jgi:hypothetical protein
MELLVLPKHPYSVSNKFLPNHADFHLYLEHHHFTGKNGKSNLPQEHGSSYEALQQQINQNSPSH